MYDIITDTPYQNTELYIAFNDLSSDEDQLVSTVQNQSRNSINSIAECNNETDECVLLDEEIENQMNAPKQEMVNNYGKLTYGDEYYFYLFRLKI